VGGPIRSWRRGPNQRPRIGLKRARRLGPQFSSPPFAQSAKGNRGQGNRGQTERSPVFPTNDRWPRFATLFWAITLRLRSGQALGAAKSSPRCLSLVSPDRAPSTLTRFPRLLFPAAHGNVSVQCCLALGCGPGGTSAAKAGGFLERLNRSGKRACPERSRRAAPPQGARQALGHLSVDIPTQAKSGLSGPPALSG